MKTATVLCAIVVCLLASCVTPQAHRTAELKIGMTKSEVIKVMGEPQSVSAQGYAEFLNYTLWEESAGSSLLRPYYVRILNDRVEAFGYAGQISTTAPLAVTTSATQTSAQPAGDSVRIVAVEPAVLTPGIPQEVRLRIKYSLQAVPQAELRVGFNLINQNSYRVLGRQLVGSGTGEVEMKMRVTPVNWGEASDFKAIVSLAVTPTGPGSRILASSQRVVDLKR